MDQWGAFSVLLGLLLGYGLFYLNSRNSYSQSPKRDNANGIGTGLPVDLEPRLRRLEQSVKSIEVEWETVFQQLKRAIGRVTKTEALERGRADQGGASAPLDSSRPLTRSEVMRRFREQARNA